MPRLAQRTLLVVGASSGIGLATATAAAREGARVALCARRADRLAAAAAQMGPAALAVPADVRDPAQCRRAVETCFDHFGRLTDLVYVAGIARVTPIEAVRAEDWREIFEVNVIAPSVLTSAVLPHLVDAKGRALYVSSIAASERPPRRGLGPYSTSKAALDRLVECWQAEAPAVSFTRVSVGDTHGTEMASGWDAEAIGPFVREWVERGYLNGRTMAPEDVADRIIEVLAGPEGVPALVVTPRPPVA